jgi:hypothetical protein
VGYDMLIVCGFAFDPQVAEDVKRCGKLTILPAKMNPDLAMGDAPDRFLARCIGHLHGLASRSICPMTAYPSAGTMGDPE